MFGNDESYIDTNTLQQMGFTQIEITEFQRILNGGGQFTLSALQAYGYNYEQAKRLKYLYDVCSGKVRVETQTDLIKHLKKMTNGSYKISIQDLAISKITEVPRVAVVHNISQAPYDVWNSKNYKDNQAIYRVVDVSGQRITIETSRKPQLQYKQAKVIPGVLEIKGIKANGNVVVSFDKKYCTLCNRFIIVASLKNPEFHLGKYEMICFEGTKAYVYALNMGTKEMVHYNSGTQRIYAYGLYPRDINQKLKSVAQAMFKQLNCVKSQYFESNSEYRVIDSTKKEQVHEGEVVL